MKKADYLLESFKNVQELIRFTDQKVGAVLVLCSIEITIFLKVVESVTISLQNASILGILSFIFGLIFFATLSIILIISILKVLKPRYAKHYSNGKFSNFYFEHIALNKKEILHQSLDNLNIKENLEDQLFEVSKILYKKNQYFTIVMNILSINIITLLLFIICVQIL